MIEIRQIHKQQEEEWHSFLLNQSFTLFTQSGANGLFYESMGESYWIFGVYDNDTLVGGSLITTVHAKRGNFLLLPYGPVFADYYNPAYIDRFFTFIKKFAKQEGYHFIRVSPFIDDTARHREIFHLQGYRPSPIHILAEHTWLLDISASEKELLSRMKKNHRNLISRCQREGVVVTKYQDIAALNRLNAMHDVVAKRHDFARFSKTFIEKEFIALTGKGNVVIFEATLPNGEVDASAIIYFFGSMAAYRHSASLNKDKRLPSSYLIQWEAIQEAKKRGKVWYNFWGIAPEGASTDHPFAGITHFKKGFGGEQKDLLPAHDVAISKRYYITWLIESLRRIKRGF